MARIVVSSIGTMGDFVPYVALAQALQARGHRVLAAVNPAMHELFRRAGIETASCGPAFGPEEARRDARAFDGWQPRTPELQALDARINAVEENGRDLRRLCRGADLLVASSIQYAAAGVSRELGLPWICVSTTPEEFAHAPGAPLYRSPPDAPLTLLASSPAFSRPGAEGYPAVHATGFWFYAGKEQPGWSEPTPELRAFVGEGDAPIAFLPASIPVADGARAVALHAEAAARLGRRLIVQRGWAGLAPGALPAGIDRSRVFFAEQLPHDWLLPRCGALIFHGGMGTLAKGLRDACPMLVEPYGRDCFFNAGRLLELGVAAAVNPHQATAASLARVLAERVDCPAVRERLKPIAAAIRAEDGTARACERIEAFVRDGAAAGNGS
ncbi:MAG: glycosyltransferase family 1 protein [Planctomycetota bacterium]|nr:glycosyltransferase family 1 protein [Planctomycetota bacterium]